MSRSGLGDATFRDGRRQVSRRTLLAAGAGLLVTPLAGCTRVSEFIADYVVGDVNLFNLSEDRLTGSLELVGPGDEVLLDESLDLDPDADVEEREPTVIYDDVLDATGPHRLDLRVEAPESDRGTTSVTETLHVTDPAEEKIVAFFGDELGEEFLTLELIADFAELEDDLED
jgi:hypothetical protein